MKRHLELGYLLVSS